MTLFSQYLRDVAVPTLMYKKGEGFVKSKFEVFKLFPVLLTILFMWALCAILTNIALEYPTYTVGNTTYRSWSNNSWLNTKARTDTNLPLLKDSLWFRFPYPCKKSITYLVN